MFHFGNLPEAKTARRGEALTAEAIENYGPIKPKFSESGRRAGYGHDNGKLYRSLLCPIVSYGGDWLQKSN